MQIAEGAWRSEDEGLEEEDAKKQEVWISWEEEDQDGWRENKKINLLKSNFIFEVFFREVWMFNSLLNSGWRWYGGATNNLVTPNSSYVDFIYFPQYAW